MNFKSLLAEFIGTFGLCFVGIGAAASGSGLLGVALAHGLAIACLGTAIGGVSGGHFNPAVSIAFLATGRQKAADTATYIIAQVLGAVLAVICLKVIVADALLGAGYGIPAPAIGVSTGGAILAEAIMTMFLAVTIWGTAVDSRAPKLGALLIGLSITMSILFGGPFTGAALNPARYLGPAIVSNNLSHVAIYLIGPIVGAVLGAMAYQFMAAKQSSE